MRVCVYVCVCMYVCMYALFTVSVGQALELGTCVCVYVCVCVGVYVCMYALLTVSVGQALQLGRTPNKFFLQKHLSKSGPKVPFEGHLHAPLSNTRTDKH